MFSRVIDRKGGLEGGAVAGAADTAESAGVTHHTKSAGTAHGVTFVDACRTMRMI